jgi:flagellar motor protein MotB
LTLETIGRQTASYRQGLVLGLTMAEIMLLLVFCLLIAAGVSLMSERAKLDDARAHMRQLEAQVASQQVLISSIRRNTRLAEVLDRAAGSASSHEIDEFWRKLVESDDLVTKMERQGIQLEALEEDKGTAVRLFELMRDGVDADKIRRDVSLASAIDTTIAEHNMGNKLTPQEIVALVEKSLSAPDDGDHRTGHTWPPIINLSEAQGYFFATGSAELTPNFTAQLQGPVAARLLEIARTFDVDVIEVIGHTDEQPVANHISDLDQKLPAVTLGGSGSESLQWADNAGLGLARALSVVEVLSADPRLRNFRILPLSAAQLIGVDGRLTRWDGEGDVRERRRIEIRMRKS